MRRWLIGGLLGVLAGACPVAGQPTADRVRIDRIVAVVGEDPILDSDLDRLIGLGLVRPEPEEEERAFRRRVLDRLIEEKLRFQEIDRFGFSELDLEEVEASYQEVRGRFSGEQAFRARLQELGVTEEEIRGLISRQILVLTYVEERLGPRVFVDLDDIRTYYDEVLLPEMRSRGEAAPPIEEVREQVRAVLKEQRLNEEIERWTEELRREADIEDYFDNEEDQELPPVVFESGG